MKKTLVRFLVFLIFPIVSFVSIEVAGANDFRYRPYLMLNGEYNDNILFRRDDKRDDFLLNVGPALYVDYRTELLDITSEASMLLKRYMEENEFDREDYYVDLRGRYRITERLSMLARLYYLQDTTLESSIIDLDESPVSPDDDIIEDDVLAPGQDIDPGIEVFYSDRKRYSGLGVLNYQVSELSNMMLRYRYLEADYDFEGNTDYDVQSVGLIFMRRLEGERNTVGARVDYAQYSSEVSDADSYVLALIWNHIFSETTRLNSEIGVRYTDRVFNESDLQTDNVGGIADIRLVRRGETNEINVGFRQDLQSGSGGSIVNVPRLYGDYKQRLTERFIFKCKGDFYLREDDIDIDYNDGNIFFDIIPSLKYRLTEKYSLSLAYSYTIDYDRDLDEDRDKQRNRVWLMFEMEFPGKL